MIYKNQFKTVALVTTKRHEDEKLSESINVSNFELKQKAKVGFFNLPGILLMTNIKRLKTSHSDCLFFLKKQMVCFYNYKYCIRQYLLCPEKPTTRMQSSF